MCYFFAISRKVSDEVDFLHADKHVSFLQIDAMIFDEDDQAFPKFPKKQVYNILKLEMKLTGHVVSFRCLW